MMEPWTDRERMRLAGVGGAWVTVFLRRLQPAGWQHGWYLSMPGASTGRQCAGDAAWPLRHLAIDAALLEVRREVVDRPAVVCAVERLLDRWD
jgi:hypothetical protein